VPSFALPLNSATAFGGIPFIRVMDNHSSTEIEKIKIQDINGSYERMLKSNVKYCFVTLKAS